MLDDPYILQLSLGPATQVDTGALVTDANRGRVFRKCAIRSGKFWKNGKPFSISRDEVQHWKNSVDTQLSNGVRIDVPSEHANGTYAPDRSRGKVIGAEVVESAGTTGELELHTIIEFGTDKHAELAATAECSIFVPPQYEIGSTGTVLHRPLREVALTQDPVVPGLGNFELVLSKGPPEMKISELAKALGVTVADGATDETIGKAIQAEFKNLKAAKKPEPAKKDDKADAKKEDAAKTVALSNDTEFNRGMLKRARVADIDALVLGRHITPAVKDDLVLQHCSDDALSLSLTIPQVLAAFDSTVATLKKNTIGTGTGEQSSAQLLELSKADLSDPSKNPLSAACKARV